VWVDPTCQAYLTADKGVFTFATTDGQFSSSCTVASWPLNTPDAQMTCSNGESVTMTAATVDGPIVFSGLTMYPKGHSEIICD
jgi:hypothetical protein